jgi:hypothetical protein
MENFLLDPEGVFYAGQSDSVAGIETDLYFSLADTERRQYGLPEVNRNIRIRENGRAIEALGICYEFTGIKSAWDLAARVAGWMVDNRYAGNNGIHAHRLADVLAIGRGMLQLFRISADPRYLQYAIAMADLICSRFKGPAGGYNQTINPAHHSSAPPQVDENISTIRYLNLLSHYTGNPEYKSQAAAGFTWLAKPEVATTRIEEAGILLADEELSSNPIRITIAGHRTDPDTQGFIKTAMQLFGWYKVIHWTDIDMNVCRSGALAANNQSPRLIQP